MKPILSELHSILKDLNRRVGQLEIEADFGNAAGFDTMVDLMSLWDLIQALSEDGTDPSQAASPEAK